MLHITVVLGIRAIQDFMWFRLERLSFDVGMRISSRVEEDAFEEGAFGDISRESPLLSFALPPSLIDAVCVLRC